MHKTWIIKNVLYRYGKSPWVREKLAEKPRNAVGYRYITPPGRPDRRVLIAILPSGKTKAVSLLRKATTASQVRKIIEKVRRRRKKK